VSPISEEEGDPDFIIKDNPGEMMSPFSHRKTYMDRTFGKM
jgi:hypothetical protein